MGVSSTVYTSILEMVLFPLSVVLRGFPTRRMKTLVRPSSTKKLLISGLKTKNDIGHFMFQDPKP
jgi:hypothetical protein